jgi:tRNA threonylcarbamoyladenosine biosynthesis protein TsaE
MKYLTTCEADTIQCAKDFAKTLKGNEIIALDGTLGMGKTVFTRAVIQYLTQTDMDVPSPTFTLLQTYDTPIGTLYHFDFYRLKHPDEAYEIGIEDAFSDGICFIEWPEKIGSLLPKNAINIVFSNTPDGRQIVIKD